MEYFHLIHKDKQKFDNIFCKTILMDFKNPYGKVMEWLWITYGISAEKCKLVHRLSIWTAQSIWTNMDVPYSIRMLKNPYGLILTIVNFVKSEIHMEFLKFHTDYLFIE